MELSPQGAARGHSGRTPLRSSTPTVGCWILVASFWARARAGGDNLTGCPSIFLLLLGASLAGGQDQARDILLIPRPTKRGTEPRPRGPLSLLTFPHAHLLSTSSSSSSSSSRVASLTKGLLDSFPSLLIFRFIPPQSPLHHSHTTTQLQPPLHELACSVLPAWKG
jgi:hypothetical protein